MVALQPGVFSVMEELGAMGLLPSPPTLESKGNSMKSLDWNLFGARLRNRREALGITQQDVEANTGMSTTYYGNWERGTKKPGVLNNFFRVCIFLNADANYFLGLSDVPKVDAPQPAPRQNKEADEVAEIVDELPASSRKQMLAIARMMRDARLEWEKEGVSKRERMADLLAKLVGAINTGQDLDPDDITGLLGASRI